MSLKKYPRKILDFFSRKKVIFLSILVVVLVGIGYACYAREFQVLPQSAISLLPDLKLPERGQRVLVFSPHPDDETIACGGFIYDSIKNGAEVSVVLVTDGNKHHLKDQRYEEFKKVTGILGVNESSLVFLNHPDGELSKVNQTDLEEEFQKQAVNFKPDIIVFPSGKDTHADHATTGRVVSEVIRNNGYNVVTLQYLVHADKFPQPKRLRPKMFLTPPLKLINFSSEWFKYDLNAGTENQKQKAINEYKTQLEVPILRSLILSFVRKNELFVVGAK